MIKRNFIERKSDVINRRMFIIGTAKLIIFGGLIARLFSLQINDNKKYLKQKHFNFLKSAVHKIKNINGSLIDELNDNSFDKVILMDHMDWMDEKYINALCNALDKSLTENGKVIFRSASLHPWFVDIFVKQYNFVATQISCHSEENLMDRVNMYASFWVVTRK